MLLELGKPVRSQDGTTVGELADVVIDPIEKRVTHLVVRPHHGPGASRLVPIADAEAATDGREIPLRITAAEVDALPNIEDFAYLRLGESPVADPDWDVGVTNVLALPYYQSAGFVEPYLGVEEVGTVYDRIPKGEVEIRRSSSVFTSEGRYVGDVDGFIVDDDEQITHLVLERGHLWGRREVTIPVSAVAKVESDTVTVGLSEREIGELPSHRVHRWLVFGG
jgi:sporulation protein YlmC with PRC-barrel domain